MEKFSWMEISKAEKPRDEEWPSRNSYPDNEFAMCCVQAPNKDDFEKFKAAPITNKIKTGDYRAENFSIWLLYDFDGTGDDRYSNSFYKFLKNNFDLLDYLSRDIKVITYMPDDLINQMSIDFREDSEPLDLSEIRKTVIEACRQFKIDPLTGLPAIVVKKENIQNNEAPFASESWAGRDEEYMKDRFKKITKAIKSHSDEDPREILGIRSWVE